MGENFEWVHSLGPFRAIFTHILTIAPYNNTIPSFYLYMGGGRRKAMIFSPRNFLQVKLLEAGNGRG